MGWEEIEKARRRLSREQGTVVKDWGGRLPVAIVYPNSYYLGMSNLGVHALYRLLNSYNNIVGERVFWEGEGSVSLESQRPLTDFAAVLFSISYELDYFNVVSILKASGIPLYTKDRTEGQPLVICNGEISTIAGRYHGLAALSVTAGENVIPQDLLDELVQELSEVSPEVKPDVLVALDCDQVGQKYGLQIAAQFRERGFKARAVDLGFTTGGDLADNRHRNRTRPAPAPVEELYGPRHLTVTADVALALQLLQVVVHHGGGANAAPLLDLTDARGVVMLAYEVADEAQDVPLLARKFPHHRPLLYVMERLFYRTSILS